MKGTGGITIMKGTWQSRGKGEEAGTAETAADWRIVDYIPRTGNMVATRSQGHVQFTREILNPANIPQSQALVFFS